MRCRSGRKVVVRRREEQEEKRTLRMSIYGRELGIGTSREEQGIQSIGDSLGKVITTVFRCSGNRGGRRKTGLDVS